LISTALGFIAGSALNYALSIYFVFHSGRFEKRSNEFIVFINISLLGVLLNHSVMYLGFGVMMINYKIVKFASLVIVTIFNYLTKKYIVFLK